MYAEEERFSQHIWLDHVLIPAVVVTFFQKHNTYIEVT
jgi:hypothetical protein